MGNAEGLSAKGAAPWPGAPAPLSLRGLDGHTAQHSRRVAWLAVRLASAVGEGPRNLELIRTGALLHDIGKATVPPSILNKPGALTPDERFRIHAHPAAGEALASAMGLPETVCRIVRHHHERWDGSGYPDGLEGGEIPRHARLVCIADVYDALTTRRSYRQAPWAERDVLATMEGEAGGLFDPELLAVFLGVIGEEFPARRQFVA